MRFPLAQNQRGHFCVGQGLLKIVARRGQPQLLDLGDGWPAFRQLDQGHTPMPDTLTVVDQIALAGDHIPGAHQGVPIIQPIGQFRVMTIKQD